MTFIGISIACWSLHLMPTVVPRQLFSLFVSLTPLHSTSTCFVLVFDKLSSLDCQRVLTRLTTVSYQHKRGTGEFNSKLCFYFQCQIYQHKLKGGRRFFLFSMWPLSSVMELPDKDVIASEQNELSCLIYYLWLPLPQLLLLLLL